MTGIDSKTSKTSACRIQKSELGMILELEVLSIYARNSGCRRSTELLQKTIQKHRERSAVASRGLKSLGLKDYTFSASFPILYIVRKLYESPGGKEG
eukprot:9325979-Pyramimonas_sp.AAC.1